MALDWVLGKKQDEVTEYQTSFDWEEELQKVPVVPDSTDFKGCFQTPDKTLELILPFLEPTYRYWEPTAGEGNIVKFLESHDIAIEGTDLRGNTEYSPYPVHDFLSDAPLPYPYVDAIIGNPPFHSMTEFLQKSFETGLPFAWLVPNFFLDTQGRIGAIVENGGVDILVPRFRTNYKTPNNVSNSSANFNSIWVTWKMIKTKHRTLATWGGIGYL